MRILSFKILSLLFIIFTASICMAAPTYGPDMPKKKQVDLGYQINYIFDRDMRGSNKDTKSMQNYLNVTFALTDWFCMDGKLGIGDLSYKSAERGYINFNTNFAGGYGFRVKCFELKNGLKCVSGFHHISIHPDTRRVDETKYRMIYNDWEISSIISKEFSRFNPYLGMKGGYFYLTRKINKDARKVHSNNYVGMVVGTDIRLNETKRVNIEGRFFDENAVSAGFMARF